MTCPDRADIGSLLKKAGRVRWNPCQPHQPDGFSWRFQGHALVTLAAEVAAAGLPRTRPHAFTRFGPVSDPFGRERKGLIDALRRFRL